MDVVLNGQKWIKSVQEGEGKKFLHLIDNLELGYHGLLQYSHTENRKKKETGSSVKDDDQFTNLLKFLLEQKKMTEY